MPIFSQIRRGHVNDLKIIKDEVNLGLTKKRYFILGYPPKIRYNDKDKLITKFYII